MFVHLYIVYIHLFAAVVFHSLRAELYFTGSSLMSCSSQTQSFLLFLYWCAPFVNFTFFSAAKQQTNVFHISGSVSQRSKAATLVFPGRLLTLICSEHNKHAWLTNMYGGQINCSWNPATLWHVFNSQRSKYLAEPPPSNLHTKAE